MSKTEVHLISNKALLVYHALYKNRNREDITVISIKKLQSLTSLSPMTILNNLRWLRDNDYINYKKDGRNNVYTFNKIIEASSYDFLQENVNVTKKLEIVANTFTNVEVKNSGRDEALVAYVETLEKAIMRLQRYTEYLSEELESHSKMLSVILGKEFKPLKTLEDA